MKRHSNHRHSQLMALALLTIVAAASLSLAGCWWRTQPSAAPEQPVPTQSVAPSAPAPAQPAVPTITPAPAAPKPAAKTTVRIYLVRGEYLGVGTGRAAQVTSPARTAMTQLLAGPSSSEKAMGLSTQIPKGTKLLGLAVNGNTATVDLSSRFESGGGTLSMTLRIAQVVNTLTQFRSVKNVAFKLDGKRVNSIGGEGIIVSPPVDRADFDSALPAIMLESPLPKATIRNPVRIRGTANTFEATFVVRITDSTGKILAEKPVMATSGTGTRGTFDELIKYKTPTHGRGAITVFEQSARDGSEINKVKIPVTL